MVFQSRRTLLLLGLMLAIITIPLDNNLNSYVIVLFCISAVIQQPLNESIRKLKTDRLWMVSLVFFVWQAFTHFWDSSGGITMKQLEPSAPFIFFPVMLAIIPRLTAKETALACYSFIASVVVVCAVCLVKSFIEYNHTGDERVFFYHYLGFQMGLNAIYLSNYCIACIAWLLYFRFLHQGPNLYTPGVIITIVICFFLFVMMFLLSSKMSIALLMLMLVYIALHIGYRRKVLGKSVVALVLLAGLAFFFANKFDYLKWRINSLELKQYSGPEDDNNGFALRMATWTSAVELIRERPLLGYGLRGANDELVNKYREKNFQRGIPERYNSHNQFLETWLESGLVGLALLVLILLTVFIAALRRKSFLLSLAVVHFVLVSMVEATLEIQQQFTFYLLFIFLFYYHYFDSNRKAA